MLQEPLPGATVLLQVCIKARCAGWFCCEWLFKDQIVVSAFKYNRLLSGARYIQALMAALSVAAIGLLTTALFLCDGRFLFLALPVDARGHCSSEAQHAKACKN
jgi:hypothetical protein